MSEPSKQQFNMAAMSSKKTAPKAKTRRKLWPDDATKCLMWGLGII